jgi:hypothetical protein
MNKEVRDALPRRKLSSEGEEEINRKIFPVYFHFVSALFPHAAVCGAEEEIYWKYVSTWKA